MTEIQILRIAYFTENGYELAQRISTSLDDFIIQLKSKDEPLRDWIKESFDLRIPTLFIGSVGIAVRTIAPFVSNKLQDCPIVVVDELGINVIPILAGHFGGANDIAKKIALAIESNPVITTATDINNVFAVDVFARDNGYRITDKDKIKGVSTKVLKGEKLSVKQTEDYILIEDLKLVPKTMVLGMGCKKGKSFEELNSFLLKHYTEDELKNSLYCICTIDVKSKEVGLCELAAFYGAKFITFSADELSQVDGDFSDSEFVRDTVGIGNVCERAALLGAGENGSLVKNKIADNGMTLAEAKRGRKWLEIFT